MYRVVLLVASVVCAAIYIYIYIYIYEGKAIPLQPWTGPEGSRRLRLPDFTTIGT
jgi:hypothetical protein